MIVNNKQQFAALQAPLIRGLMATMILFCSIATAQTSEGANKQRLPRSNRHISNTTFVAFDTETTGLGPKNNSIVEIAAVKYLDGKIIEKKNWLINPERKIPYWATKVHGITDKMVADAPTFAEMYPEFEEFIQGSILVAHNAHFDINFLQVELERANIAPPNSWIIDSLRLARAWYPELKSHSLESVVSHLNMNDGGFHRAMADSVYITYMLDDGLQQFSEDDSLRDIYAVIGKPLTF